MRRNTLQAADLRFGLASQLSSLPPLELPSSAPSLWAENNKSPPQIRGKSRPRCFQHPRAQMQIHAHPYANSEGRRMRLEAIEMHLPPFLHINMQRCPCGPPSLGGRHNKKPHFSFKVVLLVCIQPPHASPIN